MKGQKPDWIVKFPAGNVWHRMGAGWNNSGGTINLILDVGVTVTIEPGTKLVLVPADKEEGE